MELLKTQPGEGTRTQGRKTTGSGKEGGSEKPEGVRHIINGSHIIIVVLVNACFLSRTVCLYLLECKTCTRGLLFLTPVIITC